MTGDLCTLADVKSWLGLGSHAVTGITKAANAVITSAAHNLQTGQQTILTGVFGMTQINGLVLTVTVIDANSFYANLDTSGTGFSAYTGGGFFGSDDVMLQRLITGASQAFRTYTGRNFDVQTYTEKRSGSGQRTLFLRQFPIQSITSLTVDGVAIPAITGNVYIPGASGYLYTPEYITVFGYEFTRGRDNISVTYSAGYTTIPYDLAQAAIELVCFKYKEKDRIGHASKSLGGETVSFIIKALPESAQLVLDKYNGVLPI